MNIKERALGLQLISFKAKDLAWTIGLVCASIIIPALFGHTPRNQWLTGSLVNAVLFLAAWRTSLVNAILVAIFPSTIALLRGLLPVSMILMIPYIILSNIILISVFKSFKKRLFAGMVSASLVKFSFLTIMTVIFTAQIDQSLALMLQWPQLTTALAGGFIALAAISYLQENEPEIEQKDLPSPDTIEETA